MATKPRHFPTPKAFRAWLQRHHADASELLVGFHKIGTGKPSITWSEAVDQALCFGWIDGVRRRVDDSSYSIRFTPRRPGSSWSAINIRKVAELESGGLMTPAGRKAFERRLERKSRIYSYEQSETPSLDAVLQKRLKANRKAWAFFQAQTPATRRRVLRYVVTAQKEETRLKRLLRVIEAFAEGKRAWGKWLQ
jgi:uncharacterized protein YdeI (YjbR/CyaY-like superfamily)